MISEMDLIFDESGVLTLVVPGQVLSGDLQLCLGDSEVSLVADCVVFVHVFGVAPSVLDSLAAQGEIPLIESRDPLRPCTDVTHVAQVVDLRKKSASLSLENPV